MDLRKKRKSDRSDESSEKIKKSKYIQEDEKEVASQKSAVDLVKEIIAKSAAKAKLQ